METVFKDLTKLSKDGFFFLAGATLEIFASQKSKVAELKKNDPSISQSDLENKVLTLLRQTLPEATISDAKMLLSGTYYNSAIAELDAESKRRGLGAIKDALTKEYYAESLSEQLDRIHAATKKNVSDFAKILGVNLAAGAAGLLIAKQMKKNPFYGFLIGVGLVGIGQMVYYKKFYTPTNN